MLEVKRNKGHFLMTFKGETPQRVQFWGKDLNTGLGIHEWYCDFHHPNQTLEWTLTNWDKPYNSGMHLFAYIEGECIWDEVYQIKKLNNKHYFSSPEDELSFGSWESLMYGNEFQIPLNSNDIVYDLGANYGAYTMWALTQGVKQIYAFEPTPKNNSYLQKTFQWDNNVDIFDKAIFSENKTLEFFIYQNSVCNSLYYNNGNSVEVECVNLEDFIKENNLMSPTVIKCDIEGAEYDFIKSVSDEFLLSLRGMFLEYHLGDNTNVWGIVSRFLDLGFNIRSQGPPERGMGTLLIFKD